MLKTGQAQWLFECNIKMKHIVRHKFAMALSAETLAHLSNRAQAGQAECRRMTCKSWLSGFDN